VGRQALQAFRQRVGEVIVDALDDRDPDLLAALSDVGVVRRDWVEDHSSGPISAPPVEVVQRMVERAAERRPSLLTSLGLSAVQLLSRPTAGSRAPEQGRTERLAVMFTDLEGFTRYTARQGDDAASSLLVEHHRVVGPLIRSRGGRIVKRLGDGLLITYPGAEAALLAGLELVDAERSPLRLRAGLHLGDVLTVADDVIGHVVNVAARVTEMARGGEVLVTHEVREAVGGDFDRVGFSRLRRKHVKGLDEPVGVCRAYRRDLPAGRR
jgi:adenylate cyclase